MVNYSKIINTSILIIQVLVLVLAVEVGGWFLVLYILIMIAWGIWWSYKNWFTIRTVADFILSGTLKEPFYNGKIVEVKKCKKKKLKKRN